MTTPAPHKSSTQSRPHPLLPWMVSGGAFLLFSLTLNHWVSLASLPWAAKIAGWDWRPTFAGSLHVLLTFPLRWLPPAARFVGMNLFAVVCAALTLGLLARSVMLLPQDRTREQRHRELSQFSLVTGRYAWLPPVFAAALCALQISFWEHSIVDTGEMLDLLVFAYAIRCLLEYRVSQRDSWLYKMAFVYGLGTTTNWAMIGFFPLFVIALFWIRGLRIFQFAFLTRIIGAGVLGLLLYLLLPLLHLFSENHEQTFGQALVINWKIQKQFLYNYPFVFYTNLRAHLFMMSLTSVLPLFIIGIRWPSFHGDLSAAAHRLTDLMFRVLHAMFLVVCVIVFFDQKFSPRVLGRILGFDLTSYLTFYYLTALCVGYFGGYFLVVLGKESANSWERSSPLIARINRGLITFMAIGMLAVSIALALKNLPLIQAERGPTVRDYATLLSEGLPGGPAVVLSDDPMSLFLVQAIEEPRGKPHQHILLETGFLSWTNYTRYLARRYPNELLLVKREKEMPASFDQPVLIQLMEALQRDHDIYYLHPSFGYYFERFYPKPKGVVYQLLPYSDDSLRPPPLSEQEVTENQNFWNRIQPRLDAVSSLKKRIIEAQAIGAYYSRSLNFWAVELQKRNLLKEAHRLFAEAVALNPQNVVAAANQEFNQNLQAGRIKGGPSLEELEKRLGQYRSIDSAVNLNGPFDEPEFRLQFGRLLGDGGNLRQAAREFLRVLDLRPADADAGVYLAKTYARLGQSKKSLDLISQIRTRMDAASLNVTNQFQLLQVEVLAHLGNNDLDRAERTLQEAQQKSPRDQNVLALLAQFYLLSGRSTNALETLEQHLAISPDNVWALSQKSMLAIVFQRYEVAIAALDHLLQLDSENIPALVNRAIAHLQAGHLEAAQRDYQSAEKLLPFPSFRIYYGLAEIAYRRNDKAGAVKNYKLYLKHAAPENAPGMVAEKKLAEERLKKLQSG